MSRAEGTADDHRDLGHDGIRHDIHHFRARTDDAAPFRVTPYHEAVHIVQKDEWHQVLVAIHDEAGRLLRRLRVNHASEFDALVAGMVHLLHMGLLVGDDADGVAADARVATKHGLAVLGFVFVELAAVDDARDDLLYVVLPGRVAVEDAVDFLGGIERLARRLAVKDARP